MEKWKLEKEIAHSIVSCLEYKRWSLVESQEEEQYEKTYNLEEAYYIYKEKYPDKKIERKNFYLYAIDNLYDFYDFMSFPEISGENNNKKLTQDILELLEQENTEDDYMDIFKKMQKVEEEQLKKIEKDIENKEKEHSFLIEEKKKIENIKKIEDIKKEKEEIKEERKGRLKSVKRKVKIKINKYNDNTMEKMSEEYNEKNIGYKLTKSTFHSVINEYVAAVGLKEPFNELNTKYTKIGFRKKTKEFFWRLVDCAYGNSVANKNMSKTEIEEYRKCRNEIEIKNADPMIRQEILWEFVDHILWNSIMNEEREKREKNKVKRGVKFKNIIIAIAITKKSLETKEIVSSFVEILNDNGITGSYSYFKIIKDIGIEIEDLGDILFIEPKKIEESWAIIDKEFKKIRTDQNDILKKTEDYFLQPEYSNIFNRKIYNVITKIYKEVHFKKEKILEQENIYDRKEEIFENFINEIYKEIKNQILYIKKYGNTFLSVCIGNADINITELIHLSNYVRMLFVVRTIFLKKSKNYLDEIEVYYKDIEDKIQRIRNNPKTKEQLSIGWYKNFCTKLENIFKLEKEMYNEDEELMELLKESNDIVNAVVVAIQFKIFYIMNDEKIRKIKEERLRGFLKN